MASSPPDAVAAAPATCGGESRIASWRAQLRDARAILRDDFFAHPDTGRLLRNHSRLVDRMIRAVWTECTMPADLALLAVGGYGRALLFPHSDVDVLVLLPAEGAPPAAAIERFFATLWDIGIELSHAVRTLDECESEMVGDVTIRTSLLENRLLCGARALFRRFRRRFDELMDVHAFYAAKTLEQQQRHLKYQDALYNLEPNVKESPGGLRDLNTVLWISRAAGFGRSWGELARNGLMTTAEASAAARQERLIGAMRVRLHYLLGRREDRLVFDAQNALAAELGFVDTRARRASEQLMQRYYRAAKSVSQVNAVLLHNMHARLYPAAVEPVAIDARLPARRRTARHRRPGSVRAASRRRCSTRS